MRKYSETYRSPEKGFRAPCVVALDPGDYLDVDESMGHDSLLGFSISEHGNEAVAVLDRPAVEALRDYLTAVLATGASAEQRTRYEVDSSASTLGNTSGEVIGE